MARHGRPGPSSFVKTGPMVNITTYGFDAIPTDDLLANSAWQLISVLTLNLMQSFQIALEATLRARTRNWRSDYVFQSIQRVLFELVQQPLRIVPPEARPELPFAISPVHGAGSNEVSANWTGLLDAPHRDLAKSRLQGLKFFSTRR
jgi:hypothetical protein